MSSVNTLFSPPLQLSPLVSSHKKVSKLQETGKLICVFPPDAQGPSQLLAYTRQLISRLTNFGKKSVGSGQSWPEMLACTSRFFLLGKDMLEVIRMSVIAGK